MRYDDDGQKEGKSQYERPSLSVLGAAEVLTLGPNGGPKADGVFPHHTSG